MTQNQTPVTTTEHKIGKVTYLVCSSASERATDTLDKKIKKLIRKDMELNPANAPTAMMKWACSPAYCSVRTAVVSCISSDTRRTSASRTVISAATTRNAPMTVRRTLSAPTS